MAERKTKMRLGTDESFDGYGSRGRNDLGCPLNPDGDIYNTLENTGEGRG